MAGGLVFFLHWRCQQESDPIRNIVRVYLGEEISGNLQKSRHIMKLMNKTFLRAAESLETGLLLPTFADLQREPGSKYVGTTGT